MLLVLCSTAWFRNFAHSDVPNAELRKMENMKHLRRRSWAFYKSQGRPRGSLSAIGKISFKMLGPTSKPRLKAKVAESRSLLPLVPQLCRENPTCLGPRGAFSKAAGDELNAVYIVMEEEPRNMSENGLESLRSHMTRFLTFWKSFGGHLVYKHHMCGREG